MACLNKKGSEETSWGFIMALVIGIVTIALVIGFLGPIQDMIKEHTVERTVCMTTNTINNGGGLFSAISSLCNVEYIEEPVDLEQLSNLIRDTWWMYLQGKGDMGNAGDEVNLVFVFTPTKDIKLIDYFGYSMNHTRNKYTDDITKSDYAYLQSNTKANTICFDKSDETESINNLYLEKGETYYMFFYDDLPPEDDGGDKILISSNSNFDAGYWKTMVIRYFSFATPGTNLIIAGTAFYLTADNTESECVEYNILGNPNE